MGLKDVDAKGEETFDKEFVAVVVVDGDVGENGGSNGEGFLLRLRASLCSVVGWKIDSVKAEEGLVEAEVAGQKEVTYLREMS